MWSEELVKWDVIIRGGELACWCVRILPRGRPGGRGGETGVLMKGRQTRNTLRMHWSHTARRDSLGPYWEEGPGPYWPRVPWLGSVHSYDTHLSFLVQPFLFSETQASHQPGGNGWLSPQHWLGGLLYPVLHTHYYPVVSGLWRPAGGCTLMSANRAVKSGQEFIKHMQYNEGLWNLYLSTKAKNHWRRNGIRYRPIQRCGATLASTFWLVKTSGRTVILEHVQCVTKYGLLVPRWRSFWASGNLK